MICTVSDLDGTLLAQDDPDGRSLEALFTGAALPRPIVLASSRPLGDLQRIFSFNAEPVYVVSNDGATCYRMTGKHIEFLGATATLDMKALEAFEAANSADGLPLPMVFGSWGERETVCYPADPRQLVAALAELTPDRDYCEYATHAGTPKLRINSVRAFSFFVEEEARDRLTQAARSVAVQIGAAKVLSYPDTRLPGTGWVEVVHDSLDKSLGLAFLRAAGIIGEKYIAFGNAWNDVKILEQSAFSCVPSDAEPLVRDIATHISPARGGSAFCDWLQENLSEAMKHVLP